MTEKWDSSKVAGELRSASDTAAKLNLRIAKIFVNAAPDVRLKLDKIDRHRDLDIDSALGCFSQSATTVAERLLDEMEYPNGGSHRKPEHWDSAS